MIEPKSPPKIQKYEHPTDGRKEKVRDMRDRLISGHGNQILF